MWTEYLTFLWATIRGGDAAANERLKIPWDGVQTTSNLDLTPSTAGHHPAISPTCVCPILVPSIVLRFPNTALYLYVNTLHRTILLPAMSQ